MSITLDLARFAAADRIVATTNRNHELNTIVDASRIGAVLDALGRYAEGWEVPEAGVPVADVRLNFYAGERLLGHLGLGNTFLVLHQKGGFWSQWVQPQASAELRALAEIEYGIKARKHK